MQNESILAFNNEGKKLYNQSDSSQFEPADRQNEYERIHNEKYLP